MVQPIAEAAGRLSTCEKKARTLREAREAKEAAAESFRALLRERGVDGKARWDRWSGKLATDPRFKRVATPQQRRSVFEKFTRQVAEAAKRAEKEGKKELGKSTAGGTGKHPG